MSTSVIVALILLLLGCATPVPESGTVTTPDPAPAQAPETSSAEPQQSTAPEAEPVLPVDPQVTVGTLPNGLTYYIRRNTEPERRAFLRFALNAGSIQEDDDQLGLAHFVEHMAFNGTENYSGNQIIDFLEQLGMQFGPDVNAYTGFDQTVYELTVPTDDPETFRQAFSVLLEWADRMTLSAEEIEKERGVVIEEWRFRRSAAQRVAEQQYPVLFEGSRYANRLPIGDVDLIASFPPEAAVRFYEDWYRPDLASVIAVGDFDVAQVEALVTELFGPLSGPENPRPRNSFTVPEHDDTKFLIVSDPETAYADVSIVTKRPADELNTRGDYRSLIVGSLFTSMLNNRLDEISRRSDAPFIGAGVSSGRFVRTTSAASLSAAVEGNDVLPALESLLIEARRVTEHGFAPSELERAKQDRLRAMDQAFRERENTNSALLADEYVRAFLEGEAIPGIEAELQLHRELLPSISLAEVNDLAAEYLSEQNRVVLVSTVGAENLPAVSEAELRETMQMAEAVPVSPYVDRVVSSELLGALPAPGSIVGMRELDAERVIVWELSNGATVVLKPTDHRADEVVFSAFSPGGTSTVRDNEFRSAQYATVFVENMGYGDFSPPDLERALAGKAASLSPYIGELEEGLSGGSSAEDLELLFQLLHLKMTSPRIDMDAFDALKRQFQAVIANQEAQPQFLFSSRIAELFNTGHPRAIPIGRTGVDSIDADTVLRVYNDRFGNASDFTFIFVGNLDLQIMQRLVEQYIATLPASDRDDSWKDVGITRPGQTVVDSIYAGIDPVSQVAVLMHGEYKFSQSNNLAIRTVERALDIRMQEVIREEESGTYGVGVQAQFARIPHERYSFVITFRADPDRVDTLTERLFSVVEELRTTPLSEDHVRRVRETLRSGFEESLTSNRFWLGQIEYALKNDRPMSAIRRYLDLVDEVTAETITAAANRYVPADVYVQVTLYPAQGSQSQ